MSAGFTGLNTKNGGLITNKTKSMSSNATDHIRRGLMTFHVDNALNIRDAGVDVLDQKIHIMFMMFVFLTKYRAMSSDNSINLRN